MMYRCDSCGCYLDPNEGSLCDECREEIERRSRKAKAVAEILSLGKDGQYGMRMEELAGV